MSRCRCTRRSAANASSAFPSRWRACTSGCGAGRYGAMRPCSARSPLRFRVSCCCISCIPMRSKSWRTFPGYCGRFTASSAIAAGDTHVRRRRARAAVRLAMPARLSAICMVFRARGNRICGAADPCAGERRYPRRFTVAMLDDAGDLVRRWRVDRRRAMAAPRWRRCRNRRGRMWATRLPVGDRSLRSTLVQLVAPYLFSTRVVGQNTHELGLYAGAVTLLLAGWSFVGRRTFSPLRRLQIGSVLLIGAGLLLALGEYGPAGGIIAHSPLLRSFRFPCRAIVLIHFGMAVLAAIGFQRLIENKSTPADGGGRKWSFCCIAPAIALAIAGPLCWPEHVAGAALIWAGPGLLILAAALIFFASRKAAPSAAAGEPVWPITSSRAAARNRPGNLRDELRRLCAATKPGSISARRRRTGWRRKLSADARFGASKSKRHSQRK